jgi:hypothetical protein
MMELAVSPGADCETFLGTCAASVRRTFAEHKPIYICAALFAATTSALAFFFKIPADIASCIFFLEMALGCLVVGAAILTLYGFVGLARSGFPANPTRILGSQLLHWFQEGERPGNVFHAITAFSILEVSFTTLKEAIAQIHPFSWDRVFMQWDRILGFGHLPWEYLQSFLGFAPITMAINVVYDSWFVVMFGCLFWQIFSRMGGVLRLQFLLSFSFAWFFGGNLLALAFSSAGPCFYGYLYPGADPYAAQMAYLHTVNQSWPIWSVDVQQTLWRSYAAGHGVLGGISAMPSMHVTIAVLLAIWGWRTNRVAGLALTAFATVIAVGSVHLAWHYAVDGIAGAALAVIFWGAAGAVARMHYRAGHRMANLAAALNTSGA